MNDNRARCWHEYEYRPKDKWYMCTRCDAPAPESWVRGQAAPHYQFKSVFRETVDDEL